MLSDPEVFPSEYVLARTLKKAHPAYQALFRYNHDKFPQLEESWKYYRDGNRWLMKVSARKKTLFWLSVQDGAFRTTFYVGPKASDEVRAAKLPRDLKRTFSANDGKSLVGLRAQIRSKRDLALYRELLALKMRVIA